MDFSLFDRRGYPVISIEHGYAEWARNYDATVAAGLDGPLLESLTSIDWSRVRSRGRLGVRNWAHRSVASSKGSAGG